MSPKLLLGFFFVFFAGSNVSQAAATAPLSCKDNSPTAGERSMRAEAHVCEGLHTAKYYQKAPKRILWISLWFSLVWMEITSGSILMITQFKNLKRPFRRLLNVHLFLRSTWETSVWVGRRNFSVPLSNPLEAEPTLAAVLNEVLWTVCQELFWCSSLFFVLIWELDSVHVVVVVVVVCFILHICRITTKVTEGFHPNPDLLLKDE